MKIRIIRLTPKNKNRMITLLHLNDQHFNFIVEELFPKNSSNDKEKLTKISKHYEKSQAEVKRLNEK